MEEDRIIRDALEDKVLFYVKNPDTTGYVEQNRVYLYPTFLVLNKAGEPIYTWIGWPGPELWARQLDLATREPMTVGDRETRFASGATFIDAFMLGTVHYTRRSTREAHDYFRRALSLDEAESRLMGVPILLFKTAYRGLGNGEFTIEECVEVAGEILADSEVETEDALEISERLVRIVDNVGEETVAPVLGMAYPVIERDASEDLHMRRQRFYGNHALIVEKDPVKALGYIRETMPEGWTDDPAELNSFAWWCFEEGVNFEEAEELSRRSIELADEDGVKANCLDTLAELVNLRGDTAGALELILQALEIDPDNEYLKGQRTRFEEALEQAS